MKLLWFITWFHFIASVQCTDFRFPKWREEVDKLKRMSSFRGTEKGIAASELKRQISDKEKEQNDLTEKTKGLQELIRSPVLKVRYLVGVAYNVTTVQSTLVAKGAKGTERIGEAKDALRTELRHVQMNKSNNAKALKELNLRLIKENEDRVTEKLLLDIFEKVIEGEQVRSRTKWSSCVLL